MFVDNMVILLLLPNRMNIGDFGSNGNIYDGIGKGYQMHHILRS